MLARCCSLTTRVLGKGATLLPGGGYRCPLCGFSGHFGPVVSTIGIRSSARCPRCTAYERHRLQLFAWHSLSPRLRAEPRRVLHVAPEAAIGRELSSGATTYTTADIERKGVDLNLDLRRMEAVADGSFDVVWASHVMEHIDDDIGALREIHRVLSPGGVAVLPVPIVAEKTIDYPKPSPFEEMHVRAPGLDYFDRYRSVFSNVEIISSSDAPPEIQPWVYERRSQYPTRRAPLRPAQAGRRHLDAVPICWR